VSEVVARRDEEGDQEKVLFVDAVAAERAGRPLTAEQHKALAKFRGRGGDDEE
jgi:hypothetical protein